MTIADDPRLPGWVPPFLTRQRWFGGKGRAIAGVEIEDAASLEPARDVELILCRVVYADAPPDRYALLLARRDDPAGLPVLGRLEPRGAGAVVEAASDARAAGALLAGFAGNTRTATRRGGQLEFGDVRAATARLLGGPVPDITACGTEQSNTSLRVDREFVFKFFRRIETGENPEVEVGRFLSARTTFRAMAPLEGSITYRSPERESATVGVLQGWIDSRGDGWAFVLDALTQAAASGAALQHDLRRLGQTTAEFHAALASDRTSEAFRPEPVTPEEILAGREDVRARVARIVDMVRSNLSAWLGETRRLGEAVIAHAPRVASIAAAVDPASAGTFVKIRIHGDFHLGQTLKTPAGFALIDFEGEPATPLVRRRQKGSALKDVAGMLRSFDYAVETVGRRAPRAGGHAAPADLRTPFLDAYFDTSARLGSAWIPRGPEGVAPWLTLFELEKACYELEYELNNRPDWVAIPLRGLVGLLALPGEGPA